MTATLKELNPMRATIENILCSDCMPKEIKLVTLKYLLYPHFDRIADNQRCLFFSFSVFNDIFSLSLWNAFISYW